MPDAIDIICIIVQRTSRIVLEVIVVSGLGEVFGWRDVVGHAFTVPGCRISRGVTLYHGPVLGMLVQGSAGGSGSPACNSSMEMPSGVRTKAMRPSRGGRLIVTPWAMKALQVS